MESSMYDVGYKGGKEERKLCEENCEICLWLCHGIWNDICNGNFTSYMFNLNPPDFFFRRFSGHSQRWALFIYRLIGATLIEIFLMIPS